MICPKCGNGYCKITSKVKPKRTDGFTWLRILGESLLGMVRLLCGFSASRDSDVKAYWVCSKCGYKFEK